MSSPSLPLLSARRLPQPLKFPFTAYSNAHDLLAIVTSAQDVSVFRILSREVAFSIKKKASDVEVTALSWRGDGRFLGVGWSDGGYGIYDGDFGKEIAFNLPKSDADGEDERRRRRLVGSEKNGAKVEGQNEGKKSPVPNVVVLGWMNHNAGPFAPISRSEVVTTEEWDGALHDLKAEGQSSKNDANTTDLPRALTTLDATKVLPRLSSLPAHGLKGSLKHATFDSQQGVDGVLPPPSDPSASDNLQSLLVCHEDGTVQVLLDETVKIGVCKIQGKPLMHSAHSTSPSHAILSEDEDGKLHVNTIELPLEKLGGSLLHVVTTNTKRTQTLLDYIVQVVHCIAFDYNANSSIPKRFLGSLQGLLDDNQEGDAISCLYHLAMTGTFSAPLLEWMVDIMKDANTKRWEQVTNTTYANIQHHLFEHLLPALERLAMAVSTLRGFAIFHEDTGKFDCPLELLNRILSSIECLRLVAHKMLLVCQVENKQFRAFIRWFRMETEVAAAEPFSSSALESEQREVPNLDYSLILAFIKNTMTESKLALHIVERPGMENEGVKADFLEHPIMEDISPEKTQEVLARQAQLEPGQELAWKEVNDPVALLNLPAITCSLVGHVRVALKHITDRQSKMIPPPSIIAEHVTEHSRGPIKCMEMVASADIRSAADISLSLVLLSPTLPGKEATHFWLGEVISKIDPRAGNAPCLSLCSPQANSPVSIESPLAGEILDVQWIPYTRNVILALIKDEEGCTSLCRTTMTLPSRAQPNAKPANVHEVLHEFPALAQFKPMTMIVGGRKGKLLCIVFGNKGRDWKVLDLEGGTQRVQGADTNEDDAMETDE